MLLKSKKRKGPAHEIDEATRKEVQTLLGLQPSPRFSGLSLFFKIGSGYLAMALFTMAALLFSAYHLYSINRTAFTIADSHLPVLSAVSKMRSSLLAQESFAGKYEILKDPAFVQMFRQRDKESRTSLAIIEGVTPTKEAQSLKRLYLGYQELAEKLFAGKGKSSTEVKAAANGVIDALDALYVQRQQQLQGVLERADEQRISTIGWSVVISGAGFLLAIGVGVMVTWRILKSLRNMERVDQGMAVATVDGESWRIAEAVAAEVSGAPHLSMRLRDLEQRNFTASGVPEQDRTEGGESTSAGK